MFELSREKRKEKERGMLGSNNNPTIRDFSFEGVLERFDVREQFKLRSFFVER